MNARMTKTFLLGMVLVCFSAFSMFADSATVVSLQGKVEVSRGGKWVELSAKSKVSEGEVISTGFKSQAVIQYQGAMLQLGPLTRVTLEKLAEGSKSDTVSVYLNTGAVRSTVRHSENKRVSYTVRNPVAVASVRGTVYDMMGDGSVYCSEGATVVYPAALYNAPAQNNNEGSSNNVAVSGAMGISEIPASGKSNAATPANDIAPSAPINAQVVLSGQNVGFSANGALSTPQETAANTASHVLTTLNTPVDLEKVQTGVVRGNTSAGEGSDIISSNLCNIIVRIEGVTN